MDNITVTKKNNKFYVEFIDGDVYSCTVKEINKLKDIILDKTSVAVESNDLVPIFVRIKTKSCVSGQTRPTVTIKNEIILCQFLLGTVQQQSFPTIIDIILYFFQKFNHFSFKKSVDLFSCLTLIISI